MASYTSRTPRYHKKSSFSPDRVSYSETSSNEGSPRNQNKTRRSVTSPDGRSALATNSQKKKLFLDLSGTLICTLMKKPLDSDSFSEINANVNGRKMKLHVMPRKGLITFLQTLDQYYEIQLYTATHLKLAEAILREFDADFYISKIFHRDHCYKVKSGAYLKDLNVVTSSLKDSILIDDFEEQEKLFPLNVLRIKPFNGDPEDDELLRLIPFLIKMHNERDVRPICDFYKAYSPNTLPRDTFGNSHDALEDASFWSAKSLNQDSLILPTTAIAAFIKSHKPQKLLISSLTRASTSVYYYDSKSFTSTFKLPKRNNFE